MPRTRARIMSRFIEYASICLGKSRLASRALPRYLKGIVGRARVQSNGLWARPLLSGIRGVSEAADKLHTEQSYGGAQNGRAFCSQGHLDDKNAALTRQVAKVDVPTVHSDCLSGNREAESETGPVAPEPLGEHLERVDSAIRNAAALVLDFDPHAPVVAQCAEHHAPARGRVLNALFNRFITEDARICGSAFTAS